MVDFFWLDLFCQKQPSRDVLGRRCSEYMLQIYRRTQCRKAISIMLLCNFIENKLWHGCSPVNLLHIFRTPFQQNTSGELLLFCYDMTIVQKLFCCTHAQLYKKSSNLIKNCMFLAWSHDSKHYIQRLWGCIKRCQI